MLTVKIKDFLDKEGISIYALASKIEDLSESMIYKIVNAERNPSINSLEVILVALEKMVNRKIAINDLLEYTSSVVVPEVTNKQEHPVEISPSLALDLYTDEEYKSESLVLFQKAQEKIEATLHIKPVNTYAYQPSNKTGSLVPVRRKYPQYILPPFVSLALIILFFLLLPFNTLASLKRMTLNLFGNPSNNITDYTDSLLPTPILIGSEGKITDLQTQLRVSPTPGATAYEFYIKNIDTGYSLNVPTEEPWLILPQRSFCPNVNYLWSARNKIGNAWSTWSSNIQFFIENDNNQELNVASQYNFIPGKPEIIEPNTIFATMTPTLKIPEVEGALVYGFYIRNIDTNKLIFSDDEINTNEFTVPSGYLKNDTRYQWNARVRTCGGISDLSDLGYFSVRLP